MEAWLVALVISVIVILGVLFWFSSKQGRHMQRLGQNQPGAKQTHASNADAVLGLRDMLYSKERLDEALEDYRSQDDSRQKAEPGMVLGVVVEMGMEKGAAIIAGYVNGDARIFWTTGGGIIGDMRQYPDIVNAAKALVGTAQNVVAQLPVETSRPLPDPGRIRFALLTRAGMHVADEKQSDAEKPSHPLYQLYASLQDLITQLRLLDEAAKRR